MNPLMSAHKKGCLRDRAIIEEVEKCGVLDTEQIRLLFFQQHKQSRRIAQRRLKRLSETKKLKRIRESIDLPYVYYSDKKLGQIYHSLCLNWSYVYIKNNLKNWQELACFEYEADYGVLRADGFAGIRNTVTGEHRFIFLEMDIAESGNKFDKVQKYNTLYSSDGYLNRWWVKLAKSFPSIWIVTTGDIERIKKIVAKENVNNLDFKVVSLDYIKERCCI